MNRNFQASPAIPEKRLGCSTMSPVDNHAMVPAGAQGPQAGTIPLSTLIDYILQRTYHELTVLSELLPRKTDMERKIEIVHFASRTRQLFLRLLALVKWANSASKVDKCAVISSFLDRQAMYFVDTADALARMARDTLVHARLPSFSLPSAIDVLTTGTYPRLPSCIKEKIVPPDPITRQEKEQTLMRLNQIIEHRLVTSYLPLHMRKPKIENGRVKFRVEHEFEVTLTLMGEGANIPWRLLDIEILVEDPETGGGKSLVHSLQVNYIHQLVQSRLMDSERPLHDLYKCLHSFCQSLQLEVLHSQAQRLIHQRIGDHIRIEEYSAGQKLDFSYWRDPSKRDGKKVAQPIYKLRIHVDNTDPHKPLQITHFPQIQGSESIKVAQAIRSDHLSLERLLMHTIQVRGLARLKELEREFRLIVPGPCKIRDLPTVLYVPVIHPCMSFEMLSISVDIIKGIYLVTIAETEGELTKEIEDTINGDRRELRRLLGKFRMFLGLNRCRKSIQHLPVTTHDHLPLCQVADHPVEQLSRNKLFIQIPKQPDHYLVAEAYETNKKAVDYRYYLLEVEAMSYDTEAAYVADDIPKVFLKPKDMTELDTFACTHGSFAKIFDTQEDDTNPFARKRKLLQGGMLGPTAKRHKSCPYFIPELGHILALCEDKIPFIMLRLQLEKKGLLHQGVQVEGDGTGLALTLLSMPPCPGISKAASQALKKALLSCTFRINRKDSRVWLLEAVFTDCPIKSSDPKEQASVHRVYFAYDMTRLYTMEKTVQKFLEEWNALAQLYELVLKFAAVYNESSMLQKYIDVKTYSYNRLVLAYGPNKCYTACIRYLMNEFSLTFGTVSKAQIANCHFTLASQLQRGLNNSKSIADLAQVLIDTWSPITSIGKLNTAPMAGLAVWPSQPVPCFTVIPQSTTHIRVTFRNNYCIDIHCRSGQAVGVRDGAYSMFDNSHVIEGLDPIPGLQSFLNLFVDEAVSANHQRRRSVTEDDNPPSPVGMDTMDAFMSQQPSSGSPAGKHKQEGLRFHSPMTPPSNPHTPASPGGLRMSQPHPSPAGANFPLVSPPSLQPVVTPSPSNVMAPSPGTSALHVPSPSSFVPAPSPQSLGIHMPSPAAAQFISPQGMVEGGGSPFTGPLISPSPGARNWPGSPSMPGPSPVSRHGAAPSPGHPALHSPQTQTKDMEHSRAGGSIFHPPSRMIPQRSWAASVETLLSHDALDKLLSPSPTPGAGGSNPTVPCCPLERFMGCVFLRRHIQRIVLRDENLQGLPVAEAGVVAFRADTLQFKLSLNPAHLQTLHLKVSPMQDYIAQWSEPDELQVLEKFFEVKVVSAPYKSHNMTAFSHLLNAPLSVLKNCVQIMRLDLLPDPNLKWSVSWCLTIPPGVSHIASIGTPAVIIKNTRILFILQLSRMTPTAPPSGESQQLNVPILYDTNTNQTTLGEQRTVGPLTPVNQAITNILQRVSKPGDCSIYPAVRELLTSLIIP